MARKLAAEPPDVSTLRQYLDEMLHVESERGAAIVGGCMVEEALHALVTAAIEPEAARNARAFGRNGAIGSFNGSIEYAFATGLISELEKSEAAKIKDVRNLAAHGLEPGVSWSFAANSVVWEYPFHAREMASQRERFSTVVTSLSAKLWYRVREARRILATDDHRGRALATAWLLEAVLDGWSNRTYLALRDAPPPSDDERVEP